MEELIKKFDEHNKDFIENYFAKKKIIYPMTMILLPTGNVIASELDFSTKEHKLISIRGIARVLKISEAIAYAIVSEAWSIEATPDMDVTNVTPSQHPDKMEGVFYHLETPTETHLTIWDIKRPEGIEPFLVLTEKGEDNNNQTSGLFTGLFNHENL